jgi:hypothetical protein
MSPCPPLLGCPAKTESPTDNWLGFAVDAAMFLLLVIMWQATRLYNRLMRRLNHKERMRLMWTIKSIAPEVRWSPRGLGHGSCFVKRLLCCAGTVWPLQLVLFQVPETAHAIATRDSGTQ